MASAKKVANFVRTEHVCDVNNIVIDDRNERNHLLLSTTYGLNSSHTKKIHVGLQATNEGNFAPIVKLTGNYTDGICFDYNTWQQFQQSCMEHMKLYLCEEQKTQSSPIIVGNISVNFTSAYGSRAVLVAYKENNADSSMSNAETEDQAQPPMKKKRKSFNVAVVMQKATFLGLENITKCVNAHLSQLVSIDDIVNSCIKYVITEIELKLPTSYIDCEIIKLTIKGNYQDIKRNVQTQINNLTFLDTYFDIVFVELLTLQLNTISRVILLKRKV